VTSSAFKFTSRKTQRSEWPQEVDAVGSRARDAGFATFSRQSDAAIATALAPGTRNVCSPRSMFPNPDGALEPWSVLYGRVAYPAPRFLPFSFSADAVVFNGDGFAKWPWAENGSAHFHKVTVARGFLARRSRCRDGIKGGR